MILEGKIDVRAAATTTWDFLLDIDQFTSCLPGVEEVTQIDDQTFRGTLAASVGPISGRFSFRAAVVESRPPREMLVRMEGTDSVTKSSVNSDLTMTLNERKENLTDISYRADVDVKGRLAILGDMVLRATANLLLEEFSRRLRERLEGQAP